MSNSAIIKISVLNEIDARIRRTGYSAPAFRLKLMNIRHLATIFEASYDKREALKYLITRHNTEDVIELINTYYTQHKDKLDSLLLLL